MDKLDSQFAKRTTFGEEIKVKILLSSLASYNRSTHLTDSLNTLSKNIIMWKYVTPNLMGEDRRLRTLPKLVDKGLLLEDGSHAVSVPGKSYGAHLNRFVPQAGSSLRCCGCSSPEILP